MEHGSCPTWLSGTLARHACGVYGETGRPTEDNMLNGVEHVFDCVEMGQGYSFSDGEVTFTSRLVCLGLRRLSISDNLYFGIPKRERAWKKRVSSVFLEDSTTPAMWSCGGSTRRT